MGPTQTTLRPVRRSRSALAIAAAAALLAAAAGCGSSDKNDTLTKAQVIRQGTVVCKAAERRVNQLPSPTSEHPFAKDASAAEKKSARKFLSGYADALEMSRQGLQRLDAPAQDKNLLDGYIRDLGTIVEKIRAASTADDQHAEALANEGFQLFDKASKQTAAYGFPKGVCGSGSSS